MESRNLPSVSKPKPAGPRSSLGKALIFAGMTATANLVGGCVAPGENTGEAAQALAQAPFSKSGYNYGLPYIWHNPNGDTEAYFHTDELSNLDDDLVYTISHDGGKTYDPIQLVKGINPGDLPGDGPNQGNPRFCSADKCGKDVLLFGTTQFGNNDIAQCDFDFNAKKATNCQIWPGNDSNNFQAPAFIDGSTFYYRYKNELRHQPVPGGAVEVVNGISQTSDFSIIGKKAVFGADNMNPSFGLSDVYAADFDGTTVSNPVNLNDPPYNANINNNKYQSGIVDPQNGDVYVIDATTGKDIVYVDPGVMPINNPDGGAGGSDGGTTTTTDPTTTTTDTGTTTTTTETGTTTTTTTDTGTTTTTKTDTGTTTSTTETGTTTSGTTETGDAECEPADTQVFSRENVKITDCKPDGSFHFWVKQAPVTFETSHQVISIFNVIPNGKNEGQHTNPNGWDFGYGTGLEFTMRDLNGEKFFVLLDGEGAGADGTVAEFRAPKDLNLNPLRNQGIVSTRQITILQDSMHFSPEKSCDMVTQTCTALLPIRPLSPYGANPPLDAATLSTTTIQASNGEVLQRPQSIFARLDEKGKTKRFASNSEDLPLVEKSGCSCQTPGQGQEDTSAAIFVVLAGAAIASRRRRTSAHA